MLRNLCVQAIFNALLHKSLGNLDVVHLVNSKRSRGMQHGEEDPLVWLGMTRENYKVFNFSKSSGVSIA